MIKPTVGRIVWYTPYQSDEFQKVDGQPLAAIVSHVVDDQTVNLSVIDAGGVHHPRLSIRLIQPGNETPGVGYCEWMPYQVGQAARTEAAESKLAGK